MESIDVKSQMNSKYKIWSIGKPCQHYGDILCYLILKCYLPSLVITYNIAAIMSYPMVFSFYVVLRVCQLFWWLDHRMFDVITFFINLDVEILLFLLSKKCLSFLESESCNIFSFFPGKIGKMLSFILILSLPLISLAFDGV